MASQPSIAAFEPVRYDQSPVIDLLRAAAQGWVGVDQRLLKSILDRGDSAVTDVLAFSRESHERDRIDLDLIIADLFHHFISCSWVGQDGGTGFSLWGPSSTDSSRTPEALEFFIDAIRRDPLEVDDSIIESMLAFGERAVEPLLHLYEELDEELGSDVAFLLAGLRVPDPRVLHLLLERLEYDAADGAFCLGLYGDPAARSALEKMLAEIPEADAELRREFTFALAQLDAPSVPYKPEPFDIFAEYPERALPEFEALTATERLELLSSSDIEIRAEAAHSFFNSELQPDARTALFRLAQSDPAPAVRGHAWESLADGFADPGDAPAIRSAMLAVLRDASRPMEERGGAAVGLYGVADDPEVRPLIEALYEDGGAGRAKALEAMRRSLYDPFAKYFPVNLDAEDRPILREALRGAGYFRLSSQADKIASYFGDKSVREDALFAYAMAMPGETTRGRARGMLRKIEALTPLTDSEIQIVTFAIDERLRLHDLAPVFETDFSKEEEEPEPAPAVAKVGRNDPCPCGSGKKYKKCHGG